MASTPTRTTQEPAAGETDHRRALRSSTSRNTTDVHRLMWNGPVK